MGGLGGGGGATIIQAPPPPPNPDINPAEVQSLADIATQRYQQEVVDPEMLNLKYQEQSQVPAEYGITGFFPEEQQQFAQTATAQVQDLYSEPSVSAELAAQQSMFQAGLANLASMTAAAQQRAQLQASQYQAYAQSIPNMALGFQNLFGQQNQQPQQQQAPMSYPGANPSTSPGGII